MNLILIVFIFLIHESETHFLGTSNMIKDYLFDDFRGIQSININGGKIKSGFNLDIYGQLECKTPFPTKLPFFYGALPPENSMYELGCDSKKCKIFDPYFTTKVGVTNILVVSSGSNLAYEVRSLLKSLKSEIPNSQVKLAITYAASKFMDIKRTTDTLLDPLELTFGDCDLNPIDINLIKDTQYYYEITYSLGENSFTDKISVYDDSWEWNLMNALDKHNYKFDGTADSLKKASVFPPHAKLSLWADLMIIYPLGSNLLADIVIGKAYNLPTLIAKSWPWGFKPVISCPSMTSWMYKNPVTLEAIIKISALGSIVVLGKPDPIIGLGVNDIFKSPSIVSDPKFTVGIILSILKSKNAEVDGLWPIISFIIQDSGVKGVKSCQVTKGKIDCELEDKYESLRGSAKHVPYEPKGNHKANNLNPSDDIQKLWKYSVVKKEKLLLEIDSSIENDELKEINSLVMIEKKRLERFNDINLFG